MVLNGINLPSKTNRGFSFIDMKVKVTNIIYDTDIADDSSQFTLNSELPTEMIVDVEGVIDIESEVADAISDKTGWCVESYNYEIL